MLSGYGAWRSAALLSRRFIGVYRAWLAADEMLLAGVQLNARRRWRGKKHVPDSQNRGAVTRRCCGARRPIDHQSLPSRMRRSLPHDFGAPTPKRAVPSYTPSPFGRCCPCSLPCYATCRLCSSSFLLPSPVHAPSLSPSSSTSEVSTRQLPCLRATWPLTRASRPGPALVSGWSHIWMAWPRLVAFADSGDNYNRAAQLELGSASRNSERRLWRCPIATIWHSTGGGACHGRCSVPQVLDRGNPDDAIVFGAGCCGTQRVRGSRRRPASRRHSRTQRRRRPSPSSACLLSLSASSVELFYSDFSRGKSVCSVYAWMCEKNYDILLELYYLSFFFPPRLRFRFFCLFFVPYPFIGMTGSNAAVG